MIVTFKSRYDIIGFYHEYDKKIVIISNYNETEDIGFQLNKSLRIVTDSKRTFGLLEFMLEKENFISNFIYPPCDAPNRAYIDIEFKQNQEVKFYFDEYFGYLMLLFDNSSKIDRWERLRNTMLSVAFGNRNEIVAIIFQGIEYDPDYIKIQKWESEN